MEGLPPGNRRCAHLRPASTPRQEELQDCEVALPRGSVEGPDSVLRGQTQFRASHGAQQEQLHDPHVPCMGSDREGTFPQAPSGPRLGPEAEE